MQYILIDSVFVVVAPVPGGSSFRPLFLSLEPRLLERRVLNRSATTLGKSSLLRRLPSGLGVLLTPIVVACFDGACLHLFDIFRILID